MPFKFEPLPLLPEVVVVEPPAFGDDRGWFAETYKQSEFRRHGIADEFRQDNHSFSAKRGTLRGLHFQNPPAAQGKLVRVLRGEIVDVAVDIRKGSPTYGKWASATLSAENRRMIWVPPGFAHGAQTLADDTELVYKVTAEFSKEHDRSMRWNDPAVGVSWPIANPILSPKDRDAPLLAAADNRYVFATPSAPKAGRRP